MTTQRCCGPAPGQARPGEVCGTYEPCERCAGVLEGVELIQMSALTFDEMLAGMEELSRRMAPLGEPLPEIVRRP